MKIVFDNNSAHINCTKEPVYALINTSDYMENWCGKTKHDSSLFILKHSELTEYGWHGEVDIEIGEQLCSDDYGCDAQLIRLS